MPSKNGFCEFPRPKIANLNFQKLFSFREKCMFTKKGRLPTKLAFSGFVAGKKFCPKRLANNGFFVLGLFFPIIFNDSEKETKKEKTAGVKARRFKFAFRSQPTLCHFQVIRRTGVEKNLRRGIRSKKVGRGRQGFSWTIIANLRSVKNAA